jgi:hypothetical protein
VQIPAGLGEQGRDATGRAAGPDLKTRLFNYACTDFIDSKQFDELPPRMKQHVAKRLRIVLDGKGGKTYEAFSTEDRRAISEILSETKPDLWKASGE